MVDNFGGCASSGGVHHVVIYISRVEEDVDPPIVHKENCRFQAKDSLTKAVQGS